MLSHRRAARALSLAVVALVAGCSTTPSACDESACGSLGGVVTAVADDGSTTWRTTVRDSGARVFQQGGTVVVDGCRATTVLDAATGRVLLDTDAVQDPGAVVDGLVVGAFRDENGPVLVGRPLDGTTGGFRWSRTSDSRSQAPSPVVTVGTGFAVAWGDSVDVVPRPSERGTASGSPVQLPAEVLGPLAVVGDDVVLAATPDGSVYGVVDGALGWRVVPEGVARRFDTAFTPAPGGVLVSWSATGVAETAFVEATGDVRWRAPGAVPQDEVLTPGAPVVGLVSASGLAGHDVTTGMRRWTAATPTDRSSVAATRGVVATTESDEQGAVVVGRDPVAGTELWRRPGRVTGASGVAAVLVQGGPDRDDEQRVSALDPASGDVLWELAVGEGDASGVVVPATATTAGVTVVVDVPERPMVMCE
ncbi:PQQ-binding-like beta-propeller repeat protein [Oryzobacter terrae]|uniref:outer membrane protein assembly factor BamB family protein n=1 Tax=Oryzobacter terrae TaxID=1620385 RepID=UPI003672FAE0